MWVSTRWTRDPCGSPVIPSRSRCSSPSLHTRDKAGRSSRTDSRGFDAAARDRASRSQLATLKVHFPPGGLGAGARRRAVLRGLYLDPGVVEAGAIRDVRLVCGSERRHGLSVETGAQPGALLGAHHPGSHGRGDLQRQEYLSLIVPDLRQLSVLESPGSRILRMHLEHRCLIARRETAEGRGNALVGGWRDERQGIGRLQRPETRKRRAVASSERL